MKKINIIADKNKKSLFIKKIINTINLTNINKSNLNIVIGEMVLCLKLSRKSISLNFIMELILVIMDF